jgi:hypothetical protein
MISVAEDDPDNRTQPSGDEYSERTREEMMERREAHDWNSEPLAPLPDEADESIPTVYYFAEAIVMRAQAR